MKLSWVMGTGSWSQGNWLWRYVPAYHHAWNEANFEPMQFLRLLLEEEA